MFTIDENKKLGAGKYGTVFAGILNEMPVAVKKVVSNKGTNEANIHKKLVHPNIVRLLSSFEQKSVVYLVMEQMVLGDLFNILYIKNTT